MAQADEDHDSGTESDEEIDGPDLPSAGESRNSLSSRTQGVLSKQTTVHVQPLVTNRKIVGSF